MSDQPPKSTGRTLYDFLTMLYESRSILHWSHGIAWLVVVAIATAVYSGRLVLRGSAETTTSGSPWVHYDNLYTPASQPDCQNAVLQITSRTAPTKIGKRFDGSEYFTQFLEFGPFNAWISCITPQPGTMIYIGVAGNEDDKAHETVSRLMTEVQAKLPK